MVLGNQVLSHFPIIPFFPSVSFPSLFYFQRISTNIEIISTNYGVNWKGRFSSPTKSHREIRNLHGANIDKVNVKTGILEIRQGIWLVLRQSTWHHNVCTTTTKYQSVSTWYRAAIVWLNHSTDSQWFDIYEC